MKEDRQVRRGEVVDALVGQRENFEINAEFDGEPVRISECQLGFVSFSK